MPFFISLSGSPTKFSRSGFLLRSIETVLERRNIELRTTHAVDLVPERSAGAAAKLFLSDALQQLEQAIAIILLTRVTKATSLEMLNSLLERFPNDSFTGKPVLLVATG